ncbi:hypothetical protein BS78_03G418400 [Paspalum vaginatum]|nr:hypothetical protein BS78_03G418400 [Paspalum vaginatum]
MGEEAAHLVDDDYDGLDSSMVALGGEDERVMEWEAGLPGSDELTPLSQPLVPPGLAAAFRIPPEPGRTLLDVHRASAATVSRLRRASSHSHSYDGGCFPPYDEQAPPPPPPPDSAAANGSSSKRPRLVWTPQLHKRFVDVVAHLGIKNAVPKTIMQLMNVEGLTRENVASHLQKYRLYVKRMRGLSFSNSNDASPSDHIFASTPVPHSLIVHDHPHPQPLPPPQQVPTPTPPPPPGPATAYMYHHRRVPMPMVPTGAYPQYHHHRGHADQ